MSSDALLMELADRIDPKVRTPATRYRNDPLAFVVDVLDANPAPYQAQALQDLMEHRRVSLRGPHGLGKTALAAWAVLWFVATRPVCKVPTTASAWRQLSEYLWPEIHLWTRRARWDKIKSQPDLLMLKLSFGPTAVAFALTSSDEAKIEGAHSEELLYVFDEAKAIPDGTWDAAEGAFATGECYALAVSTPGEAAGRFYDIHRRRPGYEDWKVIHVTLEQAIAAGRVSAEWAEARRRQWGAGTAVYQNRVLGEFATESEDQLIPLAWVEAAVERWESCGGVGAGDLVLGVDPARYGPDKTAIAYRRGLVVERVARHGGQDTMATTGRVASAVKAGAKAAIDVIGLGAGIVDRLREQELDVIAVNAAERTDLTDLSGELGFINVRAAAWWGLRERLNPERGDGIALPPDDELIGDLTAPKYGFTSTGKIKVEGKDEIKRRLGRSPDTGDAVVLAFYLDARHRETVSLADIEPPDRENVWAKFGSQADRRNVRTWIPPRKQRDSAPPVR